MVHFSLVQVDILDSLQEARVEQRGGGTRLPCQAWKGVGQHPGLVDQLPLLWQKGMPWWEFLL